jgi:general secretion pathway protein F
MQYRIDGWSAHEPARLTLEATSADDARRQAERRGLVVRRVRPLQLSLPGVRRGTAFPLRQFNQGLLILLRSGLSVVEAVDTLAEREAGADVRAALARLTAALSTGRSLSSAMADAPEVFPALYVAAVRANETTGGLADAVERYSQYQDRADRLRQRLTAAAVYPAVVLGVGLLVVLFLLLVVVPRFAGVFEGLGTEVGGPAAVLLGLGSALQAHGGWIAPALALGLVAAVHAARQPAVRAAAWDAAHRLPRLGPALHEAHLARFYRALALLLQAGMPVMAALDLARDLLPPSLRGRLAAARQDIAHGHALSAALDRHGLATAVARRLLRVGERSGALPALLERCATFHDEDTAQRIETAVRLVEPLLMLLIGGVIGGVVLLMYMPVLELAGSLP